MADHKIALKKIGMQVNMLLSSYVFANKKGGMTFKLSKLCSGSQTKEFLSISRWIWSIWNKRPDRRRYQIYGLYIFLCFSYNVYFDSFCIMSISILTITFNNGTQDYQRSNVCLKTKNTLHLCAAKLTSIYN